MLRVDELLIPLVGLMTRELLTGGYIGPTRRTWTCRRRTKKAKTIVPFMAVQRDGQGVIFDFEMTGSKKVGKEFFKDYGGILDEAGGHRPDISGRRLFR